MARKLKKPTTNGKTPKNRSLKKCLAVATMAASLGVSLGVPVRDVLAKDDSLSTPPGYTVRERVKEEMDQLELSTKPDHEVSLKNTRVEDDPIGTKPVDDNLSVQHKKESTQFKFRDGDSSQLKFSKESSQFKESNQFKESAQFKYNKKGSAQIKLDKPVDSEN